MVFGIVRQHHGWIELSSEPGRGTRFDIYLPRHDAAHAAHALASELAPAAKERETILVVDDEEMVRVSTARMLERRGFHAITAATPGEALDILRGDTPIDLLISDVVMPETYGTDLIRQARALRPGLPALLISGFADQQNERHDPIPEGVPFLPKPFDLVDLLAQVRALLGG
jgi:two-component system cell cycle sensor histidine kinase/response regulator CckA